ncbi:lipoprotein [Micromonospora sp. KLBMP9576]|uniref:lipoprotein n=1 Tax=Micromonospora sp. KLBMP9576 TaxID=3424769 RepID=UPI003D8F1154
MRPRSHAAVLAALTIGLLAGCAEETGRPAGQASDRPAPQATGEPWYDEVPAGAPGDGTVGGAGTPCPLPVSFPLAKGWKAKAVEVPTGELAELLGDALTKRGGTTARCEVDGRSSGGGFLRVWATDQPGVAPRAALEAFVAGTEDKLSGQQFREVRAGAFEATEATWLATSTLIDEESRGWALAVRTEGPTLVITVSEGLIAERDDVLPAYRLATRGLADAG